MTSEALAMIVSAQLIQDARPGSSRDDGLDELILELVEYVDREPYRLVVRSERPPDFCILAL
jgi:hypothetical protein